MKSKIQHPPQAINFTEAPSWRLAILVCRQPDVPSPVFQKVELVVFGHRAMVEIFVLGRGQYYVALARACQHQHNV
jgi:hypothetical protein